MKNIWGVLLLIAGVFVVLYLFAKKKGQAVLGVLNTNTTAGAGANSGVISNPAAVQSAVSSPPFEQLPVNDSDAGATNNLQAQTNINTIENVVLSSSTNPNARSLGAKFGGVTSGARPILAQPQNVGGNQILETGNPWEGIAT